MVRTSPDNDLAGIGDQPSDPPAESRKESLWFDLRLFVWIGLLVFAHRAVLGFEGTKAARDPIESFFFEAGATVPAIHFALFAFVIWNRRHALTRGIRGESAPVLGGCCALLGGLVFVWAQGLNQPDLLIDSLILLLAAGALWLGGWKRLGLFVLPLAILWSARPWPPMAIHLLHEWLQTMTGDIAQTLLSPFGSIVRSGHILSFRGQLFQVIEGCSGLRSTQTLIFATLVYADLTSRSRWQTLGLVMIAPLLGIFVNGLRVISIMLFPGVGPSSDHSVQGLVMISFGILLVAGVDSVGDRWFWPRGDRRWRRPTGLDDPPLKDLTKWAAPVVLSAFLALVSLSPVRFDRPESTPWRLHEVRTEIGPWSYLRTLEVDYVYLGSVDFQDKLYREYGRGDDRITLFIATDDRRRRDKSILSPKTKLLGSGWETLESVRIQLDESNRIVERLRQRRGTEEAFSIHYRVGAGDIFTESLRWIAAYDLWPGGHPIDIVVIRVTSRVVDGNLARARSNLVDFMSEFGPELREIQPDGLS